jgi:hypothetical protein
MEKKRRRFTFRVGPLGMSLAAAAITAAAFAAISVADSGSGSGTNGKDEQTFRASAPPGGGPGVIFRDDLSAADQQKLEDFRQCMEDNGAPAPPDPAEIDPGDGPPQPPSAADQEKLRKAWEACKDKLPEDMQKAGPPQLHSMGCGPGDERGKNQNQDQSNESGTDSSGSSS